MKVALTIAGSDSGGGAGLQADLKTFAALGVYGTSVVSAVTAQNTRGVTRVEPMARELVRAQLDAVLSDFPVAAAKTGMLGTADVVEEVAAALARVPGVLLVVDPVTRASSGAALLDDAGASALVRLLLPRAEVVTPNLVEAEALCARAARTPSEIRDAARAIRDLGPEVVVVKGGHAEGAESVDLVHDADGFFEIRGPRLSTRATHGTGCTLSAAITAGLACGHSARDAALRARRYLEGAMSSAGSLGAGAGPMHHLHPFYPWGELS